MSQTSDKSTTPPTGSPPQPHYRCVVLECGRRLPVEVRLGRRLLRTIPAESDEARALFDKNAVELVPCSDH